jgi:hypothetical protein
MIVDVSRPVQNTEKIRSFLAKCLDLAEEKTDTIDNENFTCKKLENEIAQDYLNLKFLELSKSIWNKHSERERLK